MEMALRVYSGMTQVARAVVPVASMAVMWN